MRIQRRFTEPGQSPYDSISFRESSSEIRNPDGSIVFALERFSVPDHWSQVAADILAQKYFRKAGVPAKAKRFEENAVPSWLWRSVPDEEAIAELPIALPASSRRRRVIITPLGLRMSFLATQSTTARCVCGANRRLKPTIKRWPASCSFENDAVRIFSIPIYGNEKYAVLLGFSP